MKILKEGFTPYTMTLGVQLTGFAPVMCSNEGCNKQTTKEKQKDTRICNCVTVEPNKGR